MPLSIDIPNTSYSEQTVVLNQQTFSIITKYRLRSDRWTVTLIDGYGNKLICEEKCISNTFITGRYVIPQLGGELFVSRVYGNNEQPTRYNFGTGKEFELQYYSNSELGID